MDKRYFGIVTNELVKDVKTEDDLEKYIIGIVLYEKDRPNPFECAISIEELGEGYWLYLFYGEIESENGLTQTGITEYITVYGKAISNC